MNERLVFVLIASLLAYPGLVLKAEENKGGRGEREKREQGEKKGWKERENKGKGQGDGQATVEVSLSGRIEKKQWDREGKTQTMYFLVDTEGRRVMLSGWGGQGKMTIELPAEIDLADYIGAEVKLTGTSIVRLTKVSRLERVGGDAPKTADPVKPAQGPQRDAGKGGEAPEALPAVW